MERFLGRAKSSSLRPPAGPQQLQFKTKKQKRFSSHSRTHTAIMCSNNYTRILTIYLTYTNKQTLTHTPKRIRITRTLKYSFHNNNNKTSIHRSIII